MFNHSVISLSLIASTCLAFDGIATDGLRIDEQPDEASLRASLVSPQEAIALAMYDVTATDDGYHLRHPRFEVTFAPSGITFQPTAGDLKWHWRIEHAGTTTRSLEHLELGSIRPVKGDRGIIEYVRGALVEQYVMLQDAIEQRFVIPDPLDLNGADLVLTGCVQSSGVFETRAEGWRWRTAERSVDLGHVRVYDAIGRDIPADMTVTEGQTRILVAGALLARAAYPVTIDPEIGTNDFRISEVGPDGNDTFDAGNPAVAYNSADNEYLVVWDANVAGDDEFEIYGQRIDASNGTDIGNDFRISDMGPDGNTIFDGVRPAVAYNSVNNEYLVVWIGDDDIPPLVVNEREIFGQRIDAGTGAEIGPNDFRISDMGPDGEPVPFASDPGVAYNSTNNEYLVVFDGADAVLDEFEIYGQRIDGPTGAELGTNDFRISDMGPNGNPVWLGADPAVAYNSTNNSYLVVWYGDDDIGSLVNDEFEIFGQRLDSAGLEIGANDFRISDIGPDSTNLFRAVHAQLAYNVTNNEYLVVWRGDDVLNAEFEIFGQRINAATGAEVGTNDFLIGDMGPIVFAFMAGVRPAVSYNNTDNEYLVVWEGDNFAGSAAEEFEILGQLIDGATGAAVGDNDFRMSDMGPDGNAAFDAARAKVAYNSMNNDYLAVWSGDDNIAGLVNDEFEIFGQQFASCPAPCPTDVNGDGVTNVLDLIDLLLCFGLPAVPGCEDEDVNSDGVVNVLDLIDLLLAFGTICPCTPPGAAPGSLEEALEEAGLDEDDWDNFMDIMQTGTQEEKDNWHCWMTHYLSCHDGPFGTCNPPPPNCPGSDPFGGHRH